MSITPPKEEALAIWKILEKDACKQTGAKDITDQVSSVDTLKALGGLHGAQAEARENEAKSIGAAVKVEKALESAAEEKALRAERKTAFDNAEDKQAHVEERGVLRATASARVFDELKRSGKLTDEMILAVEDGSLLAFSTDDKGTETATTDSVRDSPSQNSTTAHRPSAPVSPFSLPSAPAACTSPSARTERHRVENEAPHLF